MRKKIIRTTGVFASFVFFIQQTNEAIASTAIPTKTPMNEPETLAQETTSMPMLLLQTGIVLLVIVGIIYFLLRFVGRRSQVLFGKAGMRTLGGCSLGPQKSLQVVQVGSALYVVGVGENVTLLRCIENPEEVQDMLEKLESRTGSPELGGASFAEWLTRFTKKDTPDKEEELTAIFQQKVGEARKRRRNMEEEWFTDKEKEDDR
ncbi:FliO/MopB family protein [Aneurinibacillus sp. REN35]|uniref:FliO/MopB family protein n=1 Tax=Aneurinibacillus sp. REN35 TaxID=3237286 RepID=UPI00352733E8